MGGSLKRQSLGDTLRRLGMASLTIPKACGFEDATRLTADTHKFFCYQVLASNG